MDWQPAKIKVAIKDEDSPTGFSHYEVEALTSGGLAVHPTIFKDKGKIHLSQYQYALTHVASGLKIPDSGILETEEQAKIFASRIFTLTNWLGSQKDIAEAMTDDTRKLFMRIIEDFKDELNGYE